MAKRLTAEDKVKINELYYTTKNYSAVARQLGFAPSTVKKYVIPDWKPQDKTEWRHFTHDMLPVFDHLSMEQFVGVHNYGDLCVLSDEEREEIRELWGELDL